MKKLFLALLVFLTGPLVLADGPFGNVPGEPIKPLPHYTPINPPRPKFKKSQESDSLIYSALKTPAKNGKKSVAGLVCTPSKCSLAEKGSKEYSDYSIYIALTSKPKDISSPLVTGSKIFQKKAGRLTCTETIVKVPKGAKPLTSYSCRL